MTYVSKKKRITFYGHFDSTNFGNESTLLAMHYNFRRFQPDAEFTCISTGHKTTASVHNIASVPLEMINRSRRPLNTIVRICRWICIYAPIELYQWVSCFITLGDTDVLIVPGTGLLTDACGLAGWGPYNLFKWSLVAKMCRCKLFLVSVGVGPIHSKLGRYFIKSVLSWADFRSYRDAESRTRLERIGLRVANDRIYPDLVFSIPDKMIPHRSVRTGRRVVGVGLMESSGRYGTAGPSPEVQRAYLDNLAAFVTWLLAHDYDIRLLIGDMLDIDTVNQFKHLLRDRLPRYEESRIISDPVLSVGDLLLQISETDIVVATRFHNVLLSMLCNKPVISISFHHKCDSLMSVVGMSAYCVDIKNISMDKLIVIFCDIKMNSDKIKLTIKNKIKEFRAMLDEEYNIISDLIDDKVNDYYNIIDSNNKNKKY
jgi:polysaccharide pyruvyl transferase WcaK-like protein